MKKGLIALLVILAIVLIGGCQACNVKNNLVTLDQGVKGKWGEVENQYQRRSDLIPNLVNTVKGAAAHEQNTLTAVIEARAKASQIKLDANDLSPEKIQEYQQAQGQLTQALGRLMVVSEAYPDLKANSNFLALQDELTGTNNRITLARKNFNEAVETYNVQVLRFPNSLFAGMFGYKEKGMFKAEAGAEKNPEVKF
ncbi:LemA family protein [Taibaiella chishuiensis]|uniref:LemA protein n=1 Tax=Taibaiella chishuiensis TaxID=1434707 RepID=A0A2P8CXS4_9BACT|nr:LemA family protein [Taibaiella chishuiensis]PSK89726.1 LemA protein [Taibaiella chishuiensis]